MSSLQAAASGWSYTVDARLSRKNNKEITTVAAAQDQLEESWTEPWNRGVKGAEVERLTKVRNTLLVLLNSKVLGKRLACHKELCTVLGAPDKCKGCDIGYSTCHDFMVGKRSDLKSIHAKVLQKYNDIVSDNM